MTVNKLKAMEEIVKPILEENIRAREDDFYLYGLVLNSICPSVTTIPVYEVFMWHKDLGLPSYASVSRTRRRLQAKHPDLASERVRRKRLKKQEVYKEYARIS